MKTVPVRNRCAIRIDVLPFEVGSYLAESVSRPQARHQQREDTTIADPQRAKSPDVPRLLTNLLKFRLERIILRGPQYRLLLIAAALGLLSLLAGSIIFGYDPNFRGKTFPQAVWWSFLRLTDPGYLGDDTGNVERVVSTILTILGYVVFLGALVAIMTQWLNEKMAQLEAGLTPIAQRDHVLIIGWTNRTAFIVRELLLSEGRVRRFLRHHGARRLRIAILADNVTSKLRLDLRQRLGNLWNERQIVLRTGTPLREDNLRRVAFINAAAVILPAADMLRDSGSDTDTRAIKTLLSMSSHPQSRAGAALPLAVAEILDERKIDVARGAYLGPIEILASDAIIGRLITQNVRHPGLSHVYGELLTHGRGNEIYIREAGDLEGMPFGELHARFAHAIPIGIVRPDGDTFTPLLNPPHDTVVQPDDRLAVLARNFEGINTTVSGDAGLAARMTSHEEGALAGDASGAGDGVIARNASSAGDGGAARNASSAGDGVIARTHRVLVLGWSHKGAALLDEFDSYPGEHFHLDIVSTASVEDRAATLRDAGFEPRNITYAHIEGDFTTPAVLARANPGSYDSIVLLGTDRFASDEESDARSIVAYLLLREVLAPDEDPTIIVELLDASNVTLFRQRRGEVLISPMILSHMLAQVALRREMRPVYDKLFGPDGPEIVFLAATDVGLAGSSVAFHEIAAAAAACHAIALGVSTPAADGKGWGTMRLNPNPTRPFTLTAEDRIIVLQ
ncbi:MAG TPA: NAD-binding protein [Longimicrobiales bacterium]